MNRIAPPPSISPESLREAVDWAIASRRSIRGFLPTSVPREDIDAMLAVASMSASGMNTQPWRVHVVTGAVKQRLSTAIARMDDSPELGEGLQEPYDYYPTQWTSPYVERRRKVGWDLYGLLGIAKGDKDRMHAQHGRNYRFFDAPVGLFFTVHRSLNEGSLIDYGMFLQSFMIAARARGLSTCPQVAFTKFHRLIATQLRIPEDEMLVCGMSLGHADDRRIENSLVTEREPTDRFVTHHDNDTET